MSNLLNIFTAELLQIDWMQHFTEKIRTEHGLLNFYFNRIFTINGTRFHVSVIDPQRKAHIFYLYKENFSWKILNIQDCPIWIAELETDLSATISNYQAEGD